MPDDRSTTAADADDGTATDAEGGADRMTPPGGGPRRVVSEKSVDDILASLDTGPGSDDASGGRDRDADADPSDLDDSAAGTVVEWSEGAESGPAFDEDERTEVGSDEDERYEVGNDEAETVDVESDGRELDRDDRTLGRTTEGNDAAPESDRTDGLSDRIEAGAVTGADVRAAESGEGREETPEVDDIDLSMDDLETAGGRDVGSTDDDSTSDGSTDDDPASTAGPLAGSDGLVDDADSASEVEDDEEAVTDGSAENGLFDRLRGLFSR